MTQGLTSKEHGKEGDAESRPILIVEDDADIRESLCDFLEFEGFKVYSASNGQEALDILGKIPRPCLIFLDLFMPVMNGLEFLRNVSASTGARSGAGVAGVAGVGGTAASNGAAVPTKAKSAADVVVGTPIVVVSAAPPESEIAREVKPLTARFIKKPADLELILKIVDGCGCRRQSDSEQSAA